MKDNKNKFPPIGVHVEFADNPSIAFTCRICEEQQPIEYNSCIVLFPVCDKCISKLRLIIKTS